MATELPVIAIVGPTASGKSSLALDIAERYNGEIICVDSRTIYRGMDIGTAKPSAEDQARVPHWGLDLIEPNEQFTAADFKSYATAAIADIQKRGRLPLLVGGTGLYINSVLYDYSFGDVTSPAQRERLEQLSLEDLHQYCKIHNIALPENSQNKRYVIRVIERKGISGISKAQLPSQTFIVGIATSMNELRVRIEQRAEHLFENDVAAEATMLGKKYGWNVPSMTGNVYQIVKPYLEGEITKQEYIDKNATLDYRLAKRQMTWFRRNPDIMWVTATEAEHYIHSLLVRE